MPLNEFIENLDSSFFFLFIYLLWKTLTNKVIGIIDEIIVLDARARKKLLSLKSLS